MVVVVREMYNMKVAAADLYRNLRLEGFSVDKGLSALGEQKEVRENG